jgi:PKD repeat protein
MCLTHQLQRNIPGAVLPLWSLRRIWVVLAVMLILLPSSLSGQISSQGTHFWLGFMKNISASPTCRILITSLAGASVTVSIPGISWSASGTVPANGLLVATVPNPVTLTPNTILNTGIKVQSSHPVSVYITNEELLSTDVTMVLPVELLGNEYIVQSYNVTYPIWPAHMLVIGHENGTFIEITPSVPLVGGIPAGVPFNIMLNAGQMYYLQSEYDMTGTKVQSVNPADCKKFAVISGNTCSTVGNCNACDHLMSQLFPTTYWGYEFIATTFKTRSGYNLRILAKDNNTVITINGGAGIVLNAGSFHECVMGTAAYIQSSKPVSVTQYSQGRYCDNQLGDPSMVMLPPINYYTDSSVVHSFLTGNIVNLYTNITSLSADTSSVRFNGNPVSGWKIIPAKPDYAYADFQITAGTYPVNSASGICCMPYGFGHIESFAYIAGVEITLPEVVFHAIVGNDTLPHYALADSNCLKTPLTFYLDSSVYSQFITDVIWEMGDSQSYNGYSCTHTYQASGYYTLTMSYWNKNLCQRDSIMVTIHTGPGVFVNPLQQTICSGDTVFFSATGADSYVWDAPPNAGLVNTTGSSVYAIPMATGSNPVTYSYQVTGTDTNNCEGSATAIVQVKPYAMVHAGSDTVICNQPIPLQFMGSPAGGWWTGPNVTPSGVYIPNLTGQDTLIYHFADINTCYGNATRIITVLPSEPVIASGDTMVCMLTPPVQLIGSPAGGTWLNTAYVDTNGVFNPLATGVFYPVYRRGSGNCAMSDTAMVVVAANPIVAFDHDTVVCLHDSVLFINQSPPGMNLYSWDFGDNSPASQMINPIHPYSIPGFYPIVLHAITSEGCADSISSIIHVLQPATAGFTIQPDSGCVPLTVQFQSGTGTHHWNFGDGTVSLVQNPSHTYNAAGTYQVSHHLYSTLNCADSAVQTINVYPLPVASFTFTPAASCIAPIQVQFTNLSLGGTDYYWDFGNGQTSTLIQNPVASYSVPGIYDIMLVAANLHGCTDTSYGMFLLYQNPIADFSFHPGNGCEPLEVVFSNNSMFSSNQQWDFGDGNISYQPNPTHVYTQPGTYSLKLVTEAQGGCTDTLLLIDTLTVYPKPVAGFFWDPMVPKFNTTPVQFTNISLQGGIPQWDFGDGSISLQTDPVYLYPQPGTYTVRLIESNTFGCHDTVEHNISVENINGLFVSNAFSPDDGPPDIRQFKPRGTGLQTYHLQIFDTWGNLLWETRELSDTEPAEGWDGTGKGGVPLPQDVYVWTINATFLDGTLWQGKTYPDGSCKRFGTVTLLR